MPKTVSIKTALISIVTFAAITMGGLIGTKVLTQNARDENDLARASLDQLHVVLTDIDIALVQAQTAEKNFLLQADEALVKRHTELMWFVTQMIGNSFQIMGAAPEHADNVVLMGQLAGLAQKYKSKFDLLAAGQRRFGYSPDTGLQGQLTAAREAFEKTLAQARLTPNMRLNLMQIRQYETDFMLSGDPANLERSKAAIAEMRAIPAIFYSNAAQKDQVASQLVQYETAFSDFVGARLAAQDLRAALATEFDKIDPALNAIMVNFESAENLLQANLQEQEKLASNLAMSLGAGGILLFAGLSFWVSVLIARPLMTIGTALERMRENDFSVPLRPSRITETAAIALAFAAFRTEMSKRQLIEAEISEVITACAGGDFSRRIHLDEGLQDPSGLINGVNAIGEAAQKGIGDVLAMIEALSHGDLAHRMRSDHQGIFLRISAAADVLTDTLSQIVTNMATTSHRLNQTSEQIVGASHIASQRGQTSAASLEETAAALHQLSVTVKDTAVSAQKAEEFVGGVQSRTDDAYRLAGEARAAIERIRASSKAIATIVDLIEDIAFQTNLLALNAGVEAARAGSAGLGFAVVASEVRSLAQRVSDSAGEINKLVRASEKHVGDGVDLVAQSAASLATIRETVGNVVLRVAEIAQNTDGQSHGIAEINIAVSALDRDVQSNVASLDETVAAGETLRNESLRLGQLVGHFKLAAPTDVQQMSLAAE
jgi:methyl-accepting chemotaxis protein